MVVEAARSCPSTTKVPQARYLSTQEQHHQDMMDQGGETRTSQSSASAATPMLPWNDGASDHNNKATTIATTAVTSSGTSQPVTAEQIAAIQRREERIRRHQALMEQQAKARKERLLKKRLDQERAAAEKLQQQPDAITTQQQQQQYAEKEMQKQRALHQALIKESSRHYHDKSSHFHNNSDKSNSNRRTAAPGGPSSPIDPDMPPIDTQQQQYHTVTMAIPSWLSRSTECFDMTMAALQTMNYGSTTTATASSANNSTATTTTPDFLMENFRRLYHQSLSSYRMYLMTGFHHPTKHPPPSPSSRLHAQLSQPHYPPLPPPLQRALDQLSQAGFANVQFVKSYQATSMSEPKLRQVTLDLQRKEKEQQQAVRYLPELQAKLQRLKRKQQKLLREEQQNGARQQQQQATTAAVVPDDTEPKSFLDWSQDILSFVFGGQRSTSSSSSSSSSSDTDIHHQQADKSKDNVISEAVALTMPVVPKTKSPNNNNNDNNGINRSEPMTLSDHIEHLERIMEQMEKKMKYRILDIQRMKEQVQEFTSVSLPPHQYQAAQAKVQQVLPDLCHGLAQHMKERFGTVIRAYQLLSSQTDLTRPHDWYLHARMNRRKITYHGGPTNSGKTYSALQRLKTAQRGLYLGPLRLLAAEVYDTLTMQGIYCNLMTGQEKREVPFATHSACTIEMASADREYDVVVIDEIQMIADESRGYAWTRALLSLRCKEIHVCGGLEAKDIVKKLADACGDEFALRTYKRFSELKIAKESIAKSHNEVGSYKLVQPGDCIVAFSRNDIFAIKREIEKLTKHKCCVVYGSLPPQTRAEQARRFNDPESGYDVLVASDAIGMGLNLNIRRIIFHTMYKSNGERIVRLDHSSVKQIAGRAGRRNSPFPDGEVTARDPRDMEHLRQCMSTEIAPIRQAGLMPTAAHIELFHATLQAGLGAEAKAPTQLHQLLPMFNELAVVQGNYFLCRQNAMQVIATVLSKYELPLSEMYTFCLAPLDSGASIPMNTLKNFAQKRMECAEAGLPWRHVPRQAKSFEDLSYLCTIFSQLELFLWLQYKFNRNALEIQTALARKEATTAFINTALKDAENLKLNHCYLKRDRAIRMQWAELNRRNRGPSNDNTYQPPSASLEFGESDDLMLGKSSCQTSVSSVPKWDIEF